MGRFIREFAEFDGAADKSFCMCPICEQKLDLI